MQSTPKTQHKRSIAAKIGRGFAIFLLSLVLLVFILLLLLQTAPVQNFARKKIVAYLHNKLHTRVEIGRLDVDFPKKLVLEDVFFEDKTKDTLLAGHQLKVDLDMWKLIHSDIQINEINLNGITAKIKRQLPDTTFNFQFILDAFAPASKTPAKEDTSAIKMALDKIIIDKTRLVYKDVVTGNDVDISLNHFDTRIKTFDLNNLKFEIPTINLNGIKGYISQTKPLEIAVVNTAPTRTDTGVAIKPKFLQLISKELLLSDIDLAYNNEVSFLKSRFAIGKLNVYPRSIDLEKTAIVLDKVQLEKLNGFVAMGNTNKPSKIVKITNQNSQEVTAAALPISLRVNEIEFDENNLQFDDASKPRLTKGMDYAHMNIKGLTLHANNFLFNNDTIAADITEGKMSDKSGFVLNKLQTNFVYTNTGASLQNILIQTPGTTLQRSAIIHYPSLDALQKNIGLMEMNLDINNSKIAVRDILYFAPQLAAQPAFANPNTTLYVDARVRGSVAHLDIERFEAHGIGSFRADVSGSIYGLPDPKKVAANLTIKNLSGSMRDIRPFIPANTIPNTITLPEAFSIAGVVKGDMNKMFTNAVINTNLGSAKINGTIANATDKIKAAYDANVSVTALNLGTIMQMPTQMGKLSASFNVKGKGFDPKTVNANLKGSIISADFNNYTYKDFALDASIAQQHFTANAAMKDPNLDFSLTAAGDIGGTYPSINIDANIDSIKTLPLHLTPNAIVYRGKIKADFPSLNPDALTGKLFVTQSLLVVNGQRVPIDTLSMVANYTDGKQFLSLQSDFINARLDGNYKLTQLGDIIQQSIQPYFAISTAASKPITEPYNLNINLTLVNHPTLQAFLPDLKRLDPVTLVGNFSNQGGWKATLSAPYTIFGTNTIEGVTVNANTDGSALKITTALKQFTSGTSMAVYATTLDATLANNILSFGLNVKDKAAKDKYHLDGQVAQAANNAYSLSLTPGKLMLNYLPWTVSAGNVIRISPTDINASNFTLAQNNQQLSINSTTAEVNSPMQVSFANFSIATITGFVQKDSLLVDGTLNGNVVLKNLITQPQFTTDLTLNDLSFKKDTLGNVNMKVSNTSADVFAANVTVSGRGNDVNLTGNYYLKPDNKSNFDFNLDIRQLPFKTLEALSMGSINQATGNLTGKVAINGTVDAPHIDGGINFNKTGFGVAMLGSYFTIDNETIKVNNDGIKFDTFTIKDSANNSLVLDGMAYTSNFANYRFDMTLKARNFRALNSTKKENAMYYGKLYFNSNLGIKGTEASPVIDGSLRINENTSLTIVLPQAEPGLVDRQGIIEFVDMDAPQNDTIFKHTLATYDSSFNKSAVTGFEVTANIEIVKEAEFNLIVDEGNGDFLKVKGEALLNAGIDPSGKITMTGTYELDQGAYELSFNFIHRKFDIQKGSKITWTGEPTLADVDVTAVYVANTNSLDLIGDQVTSDRNYYLQKLPFQVLLKMKGQLMQPELTFDITLPTENNVRASNAVLTTVNTKLDQLRTEPSELNKQVFALLLLNRFVGEDPFQSSGGGGFNAGVYARQSVSKILTEQLNKLATDLIAGVDINFDVNSSEDYTTGELRNRTDFNVALSKRLLNDRLKITVGSNFELEGPQETKQNNSALAGNLTIDYNLSKDGRYLLRAYRKNEFDAVVEGYIIETGLKFIISVDYNKFNEVFHPGRKKKLRQQAAEKPSTDSTGTNKTISENDNKTSADDRKTVPGLDNVSTDDDEN